VDQRLGPAGLDHAASSAPQRSRASVAFGFEAEVLPAGSAHLRRYSLSGPVPTTHTDTEHVLSWCSKDGNWVWTFVLKHDDTTSRLISRNPLPPTDARGAHRDAAHGTGLADHGADDVAQHQALSGAARGRLAAQTATSHSARWSGRACSDRGDARQRSLWSVRAYDHDRRVGRELVQCPANCAEALHDAVVSHPDRDPAWLQIVGDASGAKNGAAEGWIVLTQRPRSALSRGRRTAAGAVEHDLQRGRVRCVGEHVVVRTVGARPHVAEVRHRSTTTRDTTRSAGAWTWVTSRCSVRRRSPSRLSRWWASGGATCVASPGIVDATAGRSGWRP